MTYDIGISEIICTQRYEDTDGLSIKYDAEAVIRPASCPNTDVEHDSPRFHIHSSQNNLLRDTRAEGKLVFINLKVQRYRCSECGKIIPDHFTFYDKNSHITNRLREEFVKRCINGETFSYIARDYGVDHKTVAAAFKAYADKHKDLLTYSYTPEILGIDEAHIDDHYRLVLTDISRHCLLDMKPDNKTSTVKKYLKSFDPSVCKCVAMDFRKEYALAVASILPDAIIVIDKFHVVQEVNRCLDNVRKALQNKYKAQGVDIRRFKRSRLLFMTNWEDLSTKAVDVLNQWFIEFPELYEAYLCKETFRDIYATATSHEQASNMFDLWIDAIPDFEQFAPMKKTMSQRKEHVLNYWHYQWTNAYTESVNNLIKSIEKAGRGYKFDTLLKRCLLQVNKLEQGKFNPRTAEYQTSDELRSHEGYENRKRELYAAGDSHNVSHDSAASLTDCVVLYLESNSSEKRTRDFQQRMIAYYERIHELAQRST
ncbi:MAG: ISL3 family transposase [Lachnospiraceae bacterium]|nr:ISL3 family transposase [Lachnospiraceae bacterium]